MKNLIRLTAMLVLGALLFSSCKKDPVDTNEEELITTLTMTWTPEGGGTPVVFQFRDLDGDGGNPPVIQTAPLAASTTYNVSITLLDESVSPAGDITKEVRDEGHEHQFFFATTSGLSLSFAYLDSDKNGAPIGLETRMLTGEAGTGILRVTLRHDLNKGASGVPQGDISNAGGETDIEVDFPVTVQ